MKQRILGKSGIKVSALGLGCMSMSEFYAATNEARAIETLRTAYELGINFFDTADMYGRGENEKLLAKALKPIREKVVIGTKCGLVRGADTMSRDSSRNYIKQCCEASLKRLDTSFIDIYYLHRLDSVTLIEESMQALADLYHEGKIRSVGLCEVDSELIRRANKVFPVAAIQSEYSIMIRKNAESVLPVCEELNIAFVPFSPISRGFLSGTIHSIQQLEESDWRRYLPYLQDENIKHNLEFIGAITELARVKQATVVQIALAWLLAQGSQIIPIPGTSNVKHLQENIKSGDIQLSKTELDLLDTAYKAVSIKGKRFPEGMEEFFLE